MVIWKFRFLSYFRNSVKGQEGSSTMGIWAFLILKLSKCIHLNSYVLSPVVGWCLRLIDVQMDSVRYTYVFGHSIYEPVFFPTVFFFLPLPLTFHVRFWSCMVGGNINYIQIEEMEKHVRKSYSRPFFL